MRNACIRLWIRFLRERDSDRAHINPSVLCWPSGILKRVFADLIDGSLTHIVEGRHAEPSERCNTRRKWQFYLQTSQQQIHQLSVGERRDRDCKFDVRDLIYPKM